MAEEKEKDNFLLYVAIIAVVTITLVLMLKGRETEHLKQGVEPTKEEITKKNVHPSNKFTE
ncbi:MAG: hypothetical protein RL637_1005 [Pseudomonadota bacterium]|jgi:hypothetical protein